jgi:oligoribonuclease NrnB/cAMP/cGMP phosphodiesterase (DHH superfamily)
MTDKIVFYHKNCNDGTCAACVVAKKHMSQYKEDKINFIPVEYSSLNSDIQDIDYKGKDIIIVDFGFTPELMKKISNKATSVLMLDHHATAMEMYEGGTSQYFETNLAENCKVIIDINKSGALLTWDTLIGTPAPDLVNYISDSDLWRFTSENTKPYIASLNLENRTIENWLKVMNYNSTTNQKMIKQGNLLLKQFDQICEEVAKKAKKIAITITNKDGNQEMHYGDFVLAPGSIRSRVGEMLYNNNGTFSVTLGDMDENNYHLSFRSANQNTNPLEHYNVRNIAQYFGGGGHDSAAACSVSKETFNSHFKFIVPTLINKPKI